MAKIHPSTPSSSIPPPSPPPPPSSSSTSHSSSNKVSLERELFTIWMKSLVLNGNGCTIYDTDGRIVYRVDNYNCKGRSEVYVMDPHGKVVLKLLKKKLKVFARWEGYRCNGSQQEEMTPWFKFKRPWTTMKGSHPSCEVWSEAGHLMCYKIEGMRSTSSYKIVDHAGRLVAEVNRKQTPSGVALGDDVLSLVVEPDREYSLIMGMVVVHGLINHNM